MMTTMIIGVLSLPDFGLTTENPTYGNCSSVLAFCLKPGGKCSNTTIQCQKSNSSVANCCPTFEQCGRNLTCVQNNIGDVCTNISQCFVASGGVLIAASLKVQAEFACTATSTSAKFCRVLYGSGDSCVTSSDCSAGLTCNSANKTCQGLTLGLKCGNATLLPLCDAGLYCETSTVTCQHTLAAGAICTPSGVPCPAGSYCNGTTCQILGSVKIGGHCNGFPYLCTSGSTCAKNNTCVTGQVETFTTCTNNSDCSSIKYTVNGNTNASKCICTSAGKGLCQTTELQNPVAGVAEGTNLANCLAKYNCGYDYLFNLPFLYASGLPASCTVTNCNSEYKKYMAAASDCSKLKYEGSCTYNPFCSGFPIWAIIVIVVVAILLVLAVVFVIFLVLRKRRDYSSI